jgi:hypothetical protein
MYRTVFTPTETNNRIPFNIPREWYGKDIELIVFPLDISKEPQQETTENDIRKLKAIPSQYLFNTKNFKFSREEANNYE